MRGCDLAVALPSMALIVSLVRYLRKHVSRKELDLEIRIPRDKSLDNCAMIVLAKHNNIYQHAFS
jgi:hypothetical protein